MSKPIKIVCIVSLVLVAGLLASLYLLIGDGWTADELEARVPESPSARTSPLPPRADRRPGKPALPPKADRLLDEWHGFKGEAKRYNFTHEACALARKSIKELGCGEDLIALINALTLEDDTIDDNFDREIRQLLAGNAGLLQHKDIASIHSDPKLRLRWSYFAGMGCRPEELEALRNLLSTSSDRDAAQMGNLVRASDKDPVGALEAVSGKIGAGTGGVWTGEVFKDIIAVAGDVATFPSIEAELRGIPEFSNSSTAVGDSRNLLLEKWVLADGVSLAEHFNTHPDGMTASDASRAMVRVCRTDPAKAFELAQHFNSPAHFDSGVMAIMPYVHSKYPKEAMELAQQLSSPKDRAYAINMINNGLSDDINRD